MKEPQNFSEFWDDVYALAHSQPRTQQLHFIGSSLTLGCLGMAARFGRSGSGLTWLVAAPVCGYGLAWFSHFVFEKNKPATWTYPVWSLMADVKMYWLILRGEMEEEVQRVQALPRGRPIVGLQ